MSTETTATALTDADLLALAVESGWCAWTDMWTYQPFGTGAQLQIDTENPPRTWTITAATMARGLAAALADPYHQPVTPGRASAAYASRGANGELDGQRAGMLVQYALLGDVLWSGLGQFDGEQHLLMRDLVGPVVAAMRAAGICPADVTVRPVLREHWVLMSGLPGGSAVPGGKEVSFGTRRLRSGQLRWVCSSMRAQEWPAYLYPLSPGDDKDRYFDTRDELIAHLLHEIA
jgi:hypothetical protein